jgi:AcrR family transcriptional regulator
MESEVVTKSGPSRRERLRAGMVEDIKAIARRQLVEQGPGAVSLRGIAREMGTASSGLFRYFPSYNDLISALLVDAYNSVAEAVETARDARAPKDHAGRWFAVCAAYRRWSLDNPAEFALAHGTPVPGYQAPLEVTGPDASRTIGVALDVYASAVTAGAAKPARTHFPPGIETGPLWRAIIADRAAEHEPRLAAIILTAWTSVVGYLVAEIFGSLTSLIDDTDRLYDAHVRTVMAGMGFRPNLVDATGG